MDVVDTAQEAAQLELAPLVVREPLEAFLDEHGIGSGRVEAERIGEGHSNFTFLVTRGDARVVLRRPPRPPLPPSAHDVLREARLLRALEGTPVRVPRVLAESDESVLGVPFYVMEEMHGTVITSAIPEPLEAFLDEHGIGSGRVEAERIGEGHSNFTFLVTRGDARLVLRRPPRPPLPPSAHDVLREARLLRALEGTPVRVPRVLAESDESVLGVPFYVMEEMHGTVITSAIPEALDSQAGRRGVSEELVDALADIHAVDWRACGLEGYGKPTGYLERQLRRFTGLWEFNKTRELPVVEEVGEWLASNLPDSPESTIVHGDYRLGNVMVADDAPARLVAIFDWELSTIGDPLADVGYLTVTWAEPDDPADVSFSSLSAATRQSGFLTRAELTARYEERSGRSVSALNWYQALALWKAAVFMEGNYKRFTMGNSDDEYLAMFDEGVPALAEKAREVALAR